MLRVLYEIVAYLCLVAWVLFLGALVVFGVLLVVEIARVALRSLWSSFRGVTRSREPAPDSAFCREVGIRR